MWMYREISAPILFFVAQIEPDIRWRAKSFRLKWGGLVDDKALCRFASNPLLSLTTTQKACLEIVLSSKHLDSK